MLSAHYCDLVYNGVVVPLVVYSGVGVSFAFV